MLIQTCLAFPTQNVIWSKATKEPTSGWKKRNHRNVYYKCPNYKSMKSKVEMYSAESVSSLCIRIWGTYKKDKLQEHNLYLRWSLNFNSRIPPNGSKEHFTKLITFIACSLNRQDKSNPALIGNLSKQDRAVLLIGDCLLCTIRKQFSLYHIINPLLNTHEAGPTMHPSWSNTYTITHISYWSQRFVEMAFFRPFHAPLVYQME